MAGSMTYARGWGEVALRARAREGGAAGRLIIGQYVECRSPARSFRNAHDLVHQSTRWQVNGPDGVHVVVVVPVSGSKRQLAWSGV
jgi:hypothetical protein